MIIEHRTCYDFSVKARQGYDTMNYGMEDVFLGFDFGWGAMGGGGSFGDLRFVINICNSLVWDYLSLGKF